MAAQGSTEAHERFERLMERYAALLRGLVARHCPRGVGVEPDDIEQEARLRLWRAIEREKELIDPASYIHRIAVTTAIDALRRVVVRREDQLPGERCDDGETESVVTIAADPSLAPDEQAARHELMNRITAAVQSLGENRRRAVELHLQGLTLAEIAELQSWSEAKARNLVYRGLDDLRDALRREGIDYE